MILNDMPSNIEDALFRDHFLDCQETADGVAIPSDRIIFYFSQCLTTNGVLLSSLDALAS